MEPWKRNLYTLWSTEFLAAAIGMRPVFLFTASRLITVTFCTSRMIHEPVPEKERLCTRKTISSAKPLQED